MAFLSLWFITKNISSKHFSNIFAVVNSERVFTNFGLVIQHLSQDIALCHSKEFVSQELKSILNVSTDCLSHPTVSQHAGLSQICLDTAGAMEP